MVISNVIRGIAGRAIRIWKWFSKPRILATIGAAAASLLGMITSILTEIESLLKLVYAWIESIHVGLLTVPCIKEWTAVLLIVLQISIACVACRRVRVRIHRFGGWIRRWRLLIWRLITNRIRVLFGS